MKTTEHDLEPIQGWPVHAIAEVNGTRWRFELRASSPGQEDVVFRRQLSSVTLGQYRGVDGALAAFWGYLAAIMDTNPNLVTDPELMGRVADGLPLSWALAAQAALRERTAR